MTSDDDMPQTYNYTYDDFVNAHQAQLIAADIPPGLWETLFAKLANETFDAGDYMTLFFEEDDDSGHPWRVMSSQAINADCSIFIVDHAWTFRMTEQRRLLLADSSLLKRMSDIVGLSHDLTEAERESSDEEIQGDIDGNEKKSIGRERKESREALKKADHVDNVIDRLWKYIGTYSIRYKKEVDEEASTVWYVMDELGSRIGHSRTPNARLVPLFFTPHGLSYSVLFFTQSITEEVEIFRDCTECLVSLQHPEWADILEFPWIERDFSHVPTARPFPNDAYFTGGRSCDQLAPISLQESSSFSNHSPLRIYTDDENFVSHLSIPFELVDDWKNADIVWLHSHFYNYGDLAKDNSTALVNQFPCESCLTTKDLLASIMCKGDSPPPQYFQMTFNLNTQLAQFVSYFQRREKSGEENVWIVKPWNLARGLDMTVCNSLKQMIRLVETGPKIACKYIERPVLFKREDTGKKVKFDLRFIVFVNSFRPLQAYVYINFWIRFAINEFTLEELDDVETHFTVFNYADPTKILQMKCDEFVNGLEKSNVNIKWKETRMKINEALASLFQHASTEDVPRGVASNRQSRAMYGVDVMLQWDDGATPSCYPSILEVNFMPDCNRACSYYPDFADTVFRTLFMGEIDTEKVTKL